VGNQIGVDCHAPLVDETCAYFGGRSGVRGGRAPLSAVKPAFEQVQGDVDGKP
jgi:hypothetical protein